MSKIKAYHKLPDNSGEYTLDQIMDLVENEHPHLTINNISGYKIVGDVISVDAEIEAELLGTKIKNFPTIIEIPLKTNKN